MPCFSASWLCNCCFAKFELQRLLRVFGNEGVPVEGVELCQLRLHGLQFGGFAEGCLQEVLSGLEIHLLVLDHLAPFGDFLRLARVVLLAKDRLGYFLRNAVLLAVQLDFFAVVRGLILFGFLGLGFVGRLG